MAIKCPKCGAEFDVTLFTFARKVQCDCGAWVDMAVGHQQMSEDGKHVSQNMSPSAPPQTPRQPSGRSIIVRVALVLILTVVIAASNVLLVRHQVIVIVPVAIGAGIVFALRRSFWSLVCFGYPLTFDLKSAWIGCKGIPGYERSTAFVISIGIGLVGCALIVMGLWKALPGSDGQNVNRN
jgi:hypothetical protein